MDVRTILNFKVPDAAVQKLLPPGFEANPATSGPSAGANLESAVPFGESATPLRQYDRHAQALSSAPYSSH